MKKKVMLIITTVIVVVLLCALLCACVPANFEDAADNLEEAGYTVVATDGKSDSALGSLLGGGSLEAVKAALVSEVGELKGDIEAYVVAVKDDEMCSIYYFTDSSDAKKVYDAMAEDADEVKEEGYVIKKSGKVVFVGSEQSYKDVR